MSIGETLRAFFWRFGRTMYMKARNEAGKNLPASSGEVYVQKTILAHHNASEDFVALDVGANRGQWSFQFLNLVADLMPDTNAVILHAFEPTPMSREAYQDRIAPLKNKRLATLHPLALSNETGQAQFVIWNETAGTNTLIIDPKSPRKAQAVIDVTLDTVDNFAAAQKCEHINLLKIDTEGNDANVIEGAKDLLANGRIDVLQFEYNHRWIGARRFLKDVFDMVDDTEYELAKILPDRLEVISEWHPELERFFEANYVLIHPRAKTWFEITKVRIGKANVYETVAA